MTWLAHSGGGEHAEGIGGTLGLMIDVAVWTVVVLATIFLIRHLIVYLREGPVVEEPRDDSLPPEG